MRELLERMFKCLENGPEVYLPSKFWQQLNEQNVAQLESDGLGNLKRTLAQNYFTWVVGIRSPLFRQLSRLTGWRDWLRILGEMPRFSSESGLGLRKFYELQIFSRMVWNLAARLDTRNLLARIEEPAFGNPFRIHSGNRLISQDLANSVMELYSITEQRAPPTGRRFTVCELGAGYGRNAYAFLSAYDNCKYVIVDIPPALYVSQEYLAKVCPERKIMRFRCFERLEEVKDEFERACFSCRTRRSSCRRTPLTTS
jgi:putative sugar O-methyltransferase